MFNIFSKKKPETIQDPANLITDQMIAQVYGIVRVWWEKENNNAAKGTPVEQGVLGAILNFDFSGFNAENDESVFDRSIAVLDDVFTTKENCFINSRMHLMASEIIQRFGIRLVEEMNKRLKYSLLTIWNTSEETAEALIEEYPCLWLFHIIQSVAIFDLSQH